MAKGTPAEIIYKGSDARLKPVRNNLIRKGAELVPLFAQLSDEEVLEVQAKFQMDDLVPAATAVYQAFQARVKTVKVTPAPKQEATTKA